MTPNPTTPDTIVLIHGLWMTPLSWEHWVDRFSSRGYKVLAPAWPGMDGDIEELRRDPSAIAELGVTEIVDHYDAIIRKLDQPPIIMGHSFGGLFTQILLDRGLGAAGVAIDSAPVKGILVLPFSTLKVAFPVLRNPANLHRTMALSPEQFHYAFTNTLSEAGVQGGLRPLRRARPRPRAVPGQPGQLQPPRPHRGRLPQRPAGTVAADRRRPGPHLPRRRSPRPTSSCTASRRRSPSSRSSPSGPTSPSAPQAGRRWPTTPCPGLSANGASNHTSGRL